MGCVVTAHLYTRAAVCVSLSVCLSVPSSLITRSLPSVSEDNRGSVCMNAFYCAFLFFVLCTLAHLQRNINNNPCELGALPLHPRPRPRVHVGFPWTDCRSCCSSISSACLNSLIPPPRSPPVSNQPLSYHITISLSVYLQWVISKPGCVSISLSLAPPARGCL